MIRLEQVYSFPPRRAGKPTKYTVLTIHVIATVTQSYSCNRRSGLA